MTMATVKPTNINTVIVPNCSCSLDSLGVGVGGSSTITTVMVGEGVTDGSSVGDTVSVGGASVDGASVGVAIVGVAEGGSGVSVAVAVGEGTMAVGVTEGVGGAVAVAATVVVTGSVAGSGVVAVDKGGTVSPSDVEASPIHKISAKDSAGSNK